MKVLRNTTRKPIKIALEGGKFLHLGPLKTGRISDQALERPAVRKLVAAGEIEVVGDGDSGSAVTGEQTSIHESTHGHPQPTVVMPKGNR